MALGHPLGLSYWEGRKRWPVAKVRHRRKRGAEHGKEILRASVWRPVGLAWPSEPATFSYKTNKISYDFTTRIEQQS